MERILITGFSGFVSHHLLRFLEGGGGTVDVLGVGRNLPSFALDAFANVRCDFRRLDLLDRDGVSEILRRFRPTCIVHLAAYSSVGFSWQKPVESFANNTNVLLNLLDEVRNLNLDCRVLSVGSSEEYGNVTQDALPLKEGARLRPVSPYAAARVAQEMLSEVYVRGYGLDIVMTRSFNHVGPFQRDAFVVPSLAKQLTAIRYKGAPAKLVTGDRSIVRDFVDVRDVVRAYHDLLLRGTAGEIYNVCSGQGTSIQDVIDLMQAQLGIEVALHTDPQLLRPSDNQIIVGSCEKIRNAVGWEPTIALQQSVADILDYWKDQ